jgi:hypothetical protein
MRALLCAASVFSVPPWLIFLSKNNHRDTENAEAAQRRSPSRDFSGKAASGLQGKKITGQFFRCWLCRVNPQSGDNSGA